MIESLDDAREELKRVDHLIYVSLKYTRTVDVLLNSVKRMVEAYDFMFETLLRKAKEEKKIPEVPKTPIEKGNLIKEIYSEDQQTIDNVELYFLMRKLARTINPYKEQEFRRHVMMKTIIDGKEQILNIDIITEYYHYMLDFYKKVEKIILNKE